ncbi:MULTISPECIES: phosphoribosylaminoimidazolesuccinocarboxamide synthase [unclassified Sporolactobacillus]|uniref:phosphoribosylaminoimidazolesuccinocarboxamide synthase n=1 Tax=unclassified Sporolactobacillus TaxID=2628533 RepID=UPI0023689721|nr:phosphoribosylaminoimidazolesuccinocarboxamide synthase [Sporolactobacillus sp. CQH2019]MDD9149720.1 phosphoribosylaminoimidazolesuccinocarboxamide synthase [Sporolactobacillus sp. CQH2019]
MSQLLYEGKAKKMFTTDDPNVLRVEYKNDATAFNGKKKAVFPGKGRLNNAICTRIFHVLQAHNLPTHFIEKISETEQLVKAVDIIPIEVVIRNIVAGSLAKRLGLDEGTDLGRTIIEFYYKSDELGDPMINDDHALAVKIATEAELTEIRRQALNVNKVLQALFAEAGILLVDFKLEFGKLKTDGGIVLADEISPDTCRLWDKETHEKLDKDVFRRNIADLPETYEKLLSRLEAVQ